MLRLLQESDLPACVRIFVSTFAQPPWEEHWHPGTVRARLEQILHTPHALGVVIGDAEIQGFALGFSEPWHEGTHFYLKEMCVDHACQRRGLGSRLLEYLRRELVSRDTRRIYLLTARGDLSEAFYAKAGFYVSPKMILMARRLDAPPPP